MSISDLFDSGFRKRNVDHFAAIVRIAKEDGMVTIDEQEFLDRLAGNLDISAKEYKQILKDFKSHPINPPLSHDLRLERLYDLSRMVFVDRIRAVHEVKLLRKMAIGLGFSTKNVKYIVDKALELVRENVDLDTFIHEMKNMHV